MLLVFFPFLGNPISCCQKLFDFKIWKVEILARNLQEVDREAEIVPFKLGIFEVEVDIDVERGTGLGDDDLPLLHTRDAVEVGAAKPVNMILKRCCRRSRRNQTL